MNLRVVALFGLCPTLFSAALLANDDEPAAGAPQGAAQSGYLGVRLGEIPEAVAAHLGIREGAMIEDVLGDTPAARAGLQRHDVIVAVDGKAVKSPGEARDRIRERKAGDAVELQVKRGGKTLDLSATLTGAPPEISPPGEERRERSEESPPEKREDKEPGFLGVGYGEVPDLLAVHLGLKEGTGVLVGDVVADSPAGKAGIERYDVLAAIDGNEIQSVADFVRLLGERKAGDEVKIDLFHKGAKKSAAVVLAPRPRDGRWKPVPFYRRDYGPWFDFRYHPNDPRLRRQLEFWGDPDAPGSLYHGRLILRGPDGKEDVITLPDVAEKWDDVVRDIEEKVEKLQKGFDSEEFRESLKSFFKDLEIKELESKDGGAKDVELFWAAPGGRSKVLLRQVDGDQEIAISMNDGRRTVTVRDRGKTVVEDLPYEKLETLPPALREKVQELMRGIEERQLPLPRRGRSVTLPDGVRA